MSHITPLKALVALQFASAALTAGASVYNIPFTDDFGPQNHLSDYVIVDANGDGVQWRLNTTWNIFGGDRSLEEMRISTVNEADDWLLMPAIHMEAGVVYAVAFDVHRSDYRYAEAMEVWIGTEATAEAMTTNLMPRFSITHEDYQRYEKEFAVETTGDYRIGLHAVSAAGSSDIFVDNLSVKFSVVPEAPAGVTGLTVVPDATGAHKVELSFTTPATTVGGQPLASITRIDILRDRQLIGSIQSPAVGSQLTYTDKVAPNGMNSYSVVCYNAAGKGLRVDAAPVYVGVDVPMAPSGARIVDNGQSITISWEPVGNVGIHGMIVDPQRVTYSIQEYDFAGDLSNRVYMGSETSATLQFNPSVGAPDMAKWAIMAHSDAGVSPLTVVRMSVGSSYRIPYSESFRLGKRQSLIWVEQSGLRSFEVTTEDCADGDGGSIQFIPYEDGDRSTFSLGRLSLRGAADPLLTFRYKSEAGSTLRVLAWTADGNETELATIDSNAAQDEAESEWQVAMVPLAQLMAEPYVVLRFSATALSESPVYIDDLRVGDLYPVDLDLSLLAPDVVQTGDEVSVSVGITNAGSETVRDYTLQLIAKSGEERYEAPVIRCTTPLDPFAIQRHVIGVPTAGFRSDRVEIIAKVTTVGDLQPNNNSMSAIVGIEGASALQQIGSDDTEYELYTLDGRRVRRNNNSLDAARLGLYIIRK